ncbi:MAG: CPBP family intramembrane glutamic endopeptidase [Acidimicrobiales bacterium]
MNSVVSARGGARPGVEGANAYGLGFALGGAAVGFVLGSIGVSAYDHATHTASSTVSFGGDLVSLFGLWIGFVGAAILAVRSQRRERRASLFHALRDELGLSIRAWPDVPLGAVVGLLAQLALVPLLELPLLPFVPHLFHRLSQPARSLTDHVHGPGLVLIGVLVCVGSPIVEETFFRGLLMRSLIGTFVRRSRRGAVAAAVVLTGVLFGLAHFEALQLIALCGFGIVLGLLAATTGRLGPGIVAHAAFNALAFFTIAGIH